METSGTGPEPPTRRWTEDLEGDRSPWKDRAFEFQQWNRTLRTRRWMKALESMRPGTRQPAGNGPTSYSTAGERAIAHPTPDRRTRASRGDPRGADRKSSQELRRREIRDHPFAFVPQGKIHAEEMEPGQVPAPHPQESPRTNPKGNQKVRGTPRPGACASGPRPAHPPARAGRPARRGGNPSLGRTRRARPFEEWPAKVNDERSGVATPGAPASAGTSKVRRAGGLRGPHANASGPASDGRARRQLQARTEESGGATDSITTRTEDRATGPSE